MDRDNSVMFSNGSVSDSEDNAFDEEDKNIDDDRLPNLAKLNQPLDDPDEDNKFSVIPVTFNSRNVADKTMGIENSWMDENNYETSSGRDFAIPLPAPGNYDDISCLDSEAPNASFQESELGNLFSTDTSITNEDIRDSSASPGVCGLKNMGNTCFMSAGLQCLAANSALMQYFLPLSLPEKDDAESLTDQFSSLIQKIWSGEFGTLHPREFKLALGTKHPQFKDYRQHDCQEFLALLLDNLHEHLNTASSKSSVSDLSSVPPSPQSQDGILDDKEPEPLSQKLLTDSMDLESSSQIVNLGESSKCSHSTSSRSSESSGESRHIFRLKPIPEDIHPFKDVPSTCEPNNAIEEEMESDAEDEEIEDFHRDEPNFIVNIVSDHQDSSNNFVTRNFMKRESVVDSPIEKTEKNIISNNFNNRTTIGIQDIFKDAKTSNVNVLVTEQEANNEIRFDSEKYPKHENIRRRDLLDNSNLVEFHNLDGKTVTAKRFKETNLYCGNIDTSECISAHGDLSPNICYNNIKRMKLEEQEKNFRMECERKLRDKDNEEKCEANVLNERAGTSCDMSLSRPVLNINDEIEADKHWEKHLSSNQSVIVDTFLGQFKSTVVCSACKHVSVTYEPFMYLSVPLPHAMEQQLCFTFVPANAKTKNPVKFLLTLPKQSKLQDVKEELYKYIDKNRKRKQIIFAEVLDCHICKVLDETMSIRYMIDPQRSLYAFEIISLPGKFSKKSFKQNATMLDLDMELPEADNHGEGDSSPQPLLDSESLDVPLLVMGPMTEAEYEMANQVSIYSTGERGDGWRTCTICLEEMDKDVREHPSCHCVLCEPCIDTSCRHYGGDKLLCPVCGVMVIPEKDLQPIAFTKDTKPTIRFLNVPVVFRVDSDGDGNNNQKSRRLFGHPALLRLPNRLSGETLQAAVDKIVPYKSSYSIIFVDGAGQKCSRCMFTTHCTGCQVKPDEEIILQTGDTLAVKFMEPFEEEVDHTIEHTSMKQERHRNPLSLYDCMQAFSESEQLDEHNPWYCPACQKNQCATKTLSVWRYPDYLIVYLKRFVFHDGVSLKLDNKVTFPLTGLSLTPPSTSQHAGPLLYNLYACVCHYGGSSAGHYTAYSKNLRTDEWYLFNDECVTKQRPSEEEYSHAYILFYEKQDAHTEFATKYLLNDNTLKSNNGQLINMDSSMDQESFGCSSCV